METINQRRNRQHEMVRHALRLTANENGVCVNPIQEMTLDQHKRVLERLRELIAEGLPLKTANSDFHGDKYTECNWGLCCGDHSGHLAAEIAYPDPLLHTWPDQFVVEGRIAPISKPKGAFCPMDMRNPVSDSVEGLPPNIGLKDEMQGCYHTCRVFQRKQAPTQEQAVRLYDLAIERINNHGVAVQPIAERPAS